MALGRPAADHRTSAAVALRSELLRFPNPCSEQGLGEGREREDLMASQLESGVCWLYGSLEPHFQKVSNPSQHRPRPARRGPHLAGCLVYKTEKHLRAFFRNGKNAKQKELGPTEDISLCCSAGVGTPFPPREGSPWLSPPPPTTLLHPLHLEERTHQPHTKLRLPGYMLRNLEGLVSLCLQFLGDWPPYSLQ